MNTYALAIVEPGMVSMPWAQNPISSYHTCFLLSFFELHALPLHTQLESRRPDYEEWPQKAHIRYVSLLPCQELEPALFLTLRIVKKQGTEDGLPQKNEGDNGARFCAARLVLPIEAEALGEAHDSHLGYGKEHKGRHSIWRWNVRVVFAVVISSVGCVGDRPSGGIEYPAWVCTCRIQAHIRDGSLQKM